MTTEAPWFQKCKANHFGNCIQEKTCYNYGGMGHLKKNCLTVRGSQGLSKGNGRSKVRVNPFGGPAIIFR